MLARGTAITRTAVSITRLKYALCGHKSVRMYVVSKTDIG